MENVNVAPADQDDVWEAKYRQEERDFADAAEALMGQASPKA